MESVFVAFLAGLLKIIYSSKSYIDNSLFEKECEKNAFKFICLLEELKSNSDWKYNNLIKLFEMNIHTISDIFDQDKGVLIISKDEKLRNNRLNILGLIRNYSLLIADFTLLNS